MAAVFAGLALVFMVVNWLSVWHEWRFSNYASKALVILFLLLWLLFFEQAGLHIYLFAAGLFCSLVGDIFLLLSSRFFLHGMIAFLFTHLFYFGGYFFPPPPLSIMALSIMLFSISLWIFIFSALRRWISQNGAYNRLLKPFTLYSLAICAMVSAAFLTLTRMDWRSEASGLAVSGAILFLFSDLLLAYDRFVQPLPAARLWKRVSYHLGQLAIIASVILQFPL